MVASECETTTPRRIPGEFTAPAHDPVWAAAQLAVGGQLPAQFEKSLNLVGKKDIPATGFDPVTSEL